MPAIICVYHKYDSYNVQIVLESLEKYFYKHS